MNRKWAKIKWIEMVPLQILTKMEIGQIVFDGEQITAKTKSPRLIIGLLGLKRLTLTLLDRYNVSLC